MRSAFLVPIQMWKSTFMSWSFMSVLASASVSMIRSSFQRKQRGWIGKHTNCRNVHEGKALPSWASPLPIFPCSEIQRISRRIFWFVCSDHASAVSALALCFQRSLLLGFFGISALSSIQSWCVVGEKEHGKETCMFRQHFFSWYRSEVYLFFDGFGFAFGSYCIGRWSGTFVAMHGLWCDANCAASLNWLMWFVESHGYFVSASTFRRCLTEVQWIGWDVVFRSLCGCQPVFCLPNLGDEFFFETLFCSLRFANNHMLCQRIVFSEQEYSCTLWRWRAYDLDLGLDMTLRPATLQRWEFQFLRLAKTTHLRCRCRMCRTWKCT